MAIIDDVCARYNQPERWSNVYFFFMIAVLPPLGWSSVNERFNFVAQVRKYFKACLV